MKKFLVFFAVFFICEGAYSESSSNISLEGYVSLYLKRSETLNQAKNSYSMSKNSLRTASALYNTDLKLSPSLQEGTTSANSGDVDTKTTALGATLSQSFPTGTTLALGATNSTTEYNGEEIPKTTSYKLTLTQPLWKNRFGSLYDHKRDRARLERDAGQSNVSSATSEACVEGSLVYVNAYVQQEKAKIISEISTSARKTFESTSASYKKKLVSRLQYLSSKADKLRTNNLQLSTLTGLEKAVITLGERVSTSFTGQLSTPSKLSSLTVSKTAAFKNSSELKTLEKTIAAANSDVLIAREESKSSLDLALEASKSSSPSGASTGYTKTDADYVMVGIDWTIPVVRRSSSYTVANAMFRKNNAELSLKKLRKSLTETYKQAYSQLGLLNKQRLLSGEKTEIYAQQIKEAERQLRASRMEFEDFLVFRDRYLNERLNYWSLTGQIWQKKLELAKMSGTLPSYCSR